VQLAEDMLSLLGTVLRVSVIVGKYFRSPALIFSPGVEGTVTSLVELFMLADKEKSATRADLYTRGTYHQLSGTGHFTA
jgi:hypothetical protein